MKYRSLTFTATVGFGLASAALVACSDGTTGTAVPGSGGSTTTTGGTGGTTGGSGGTAGGGTGGSLAGTGGTTGGTGGTTGGTGGTTGGTGGTTGGTAGTTGGTAGLGAGTGGAMGGQAGMGTGGQAGMSTGGQAGASSGGQAGMGTGGQAGMGTGGQGGMMGGASSGGSAGGGSGGDNLNSGPNTMGWIGCSMGENTAQGYRRIGGTRMWGPYGNGGAIVSSWTSSNSAGWQRFDNQVAQYGMPAAVWIMICVAQGGASNQEVLQMIANARSHAPGAVIYLTGQPVYEEGHVCMIAGPGAPERTDEQAQEIAAMDGDIIYPGTLGPLNAGEYTSDTCHASTSGQDKLGRQVRAWWGDPE